MAKKGMKRIERTHTEPKNDMPPVPEIEGKAKSGKEKARDIISSTASPNQKVYHTEKPISRVYAEIDNDLARDNLENDITAADLQDL